MTGLGYGIKRPKPRVYQAFGFWYVLRASGGEVLCVNWEQAVRIAVGYAISD